MQPLQDLEIWGGLEYTINRVGDQYFDQLTYSGHYDRPGDIEQLIALGIKAIRYPILWEKHQPSLTQAIDWRFTEHNLQRLRDAGVTVIAGLVHHGSGPAYVNFFDGSFEQGLQEYATAVAKRFPWIEYYTPVNEPLTTARFCGLYGHWYPHHSSDSSFTRILVAECKAVIMAMNTIKDINPDAKLIQTEDLAKIYSTPALQYQADFENERRWLSYDLIAGKVTADHTLRNYLLNSGVPETDLSFFLRHGIMPDIIGVNHYITSERYLDEDIQDYPPETYGTNGFQQYADVEAVRVNIPGKTSMTGLITEVWMRYLQPIAITEVHLQCTREEQMRWLYEVWCNARQLRSEHIPIIAITVWALFGSYGWDNLLRRPGGNYEGGAFVITAGKPQPTALAIMIDTLFNKGAYRHPVLDIPGWWHDGQRILYGSGHKQISKRHKIDSRPLVIQYQSNMMAQVFEDICHSRGLHYLLVKKTVWDHSVSHIHLLAKKLKPWALVDATGQTGLEFVADEGALSITPASFSFVQTCKKENIRLAAMLPDYAESSSADMERKQNEEIATALLYHHDTLFLQSGIFPEQNAGCEPITDESFSHTALQVLVHTCLDHLLDEIKGVHTVSQCSLIS